MIRLYEQLETPSVIVDLDIAEANIARMAASLSSNGIRHRPHVKSHKSAYFARKQLEAGAVGITVAKLSEAEAFVASGFYDILIAYPIVGEGKLERLAVLHRQARITVTSDSLAAAAPLSEVGTRTGKPVRVLIEIDGGLHRGGRQPGDDTLEFARALRALPGLQVCGIMGYFGTIYQHANGPELVVAVRREAAVMAETANMLRQDGFDIEIVSAGSTPAAQHAAELRGITEVRAGNYVFYDGSALGLGLVGEQSCALR
ncbi:MAG: amino acid processing protein, partial [Paenibacillus sp.]|nr:amino acid processing protein [Paenibacillus sp.]